MVSFVTLKWEWLYSTGIYCRFGYDRHGDAIFIPGRWANVTTKAVKTEKMPDIWLLSEPPLIFNHDWNIGITAAA